MSDKISFNSKFPTRIPFLNFSGLFNLTEMPQNCLRNFSATEECRESDSFQFGNSAGSLDSLVELMCSGNVDLATHSFINISLPESPSNALNSVSISVLDVCAWAMSIIGCIANIITVVMILRTLRLHRPFYYSVLFLALSDICFHCLFFVQRGLFFSEICHFFRTFRLLEIVRYSIKLNSSLNVILLSLVRFLMFVHPLRSRIFLTNRKIVLGACTCLTLSIGYGFGIEYFIWTSQLKNLTYIYIIDDVALLTFLFIVIIWFLIERIGTASKSEAAKNLKTRMTLIVFAILCLNSINALFQILKKASGFEISELDYIRVITTGNDDIAFEIRIVSQVVNLFVHSINPLLYFFTSPSVLSTILSFFQCKVK